MALPSLKGIRNKILGKGKPRKEYQSNLSDKMADENIADIVRAIYELYDRVSMISHRVDTTIHDLQSQIDSTKAQIAAISSTSRGYQGVGRYGSSGVTPSARPSGGIAANERKGIERHLDKMRIFMDEYQGLLKMLDEHNRPNSLNHLRYCQEIYDRVREELMQPSGVTYDVIVNELRKAKLHDLTFNICIVAEFEIEKNPERRESDFIRAMDKLAASVGLEIFLPKISTIFQEAEHDIVSHESNTSYAPGSIIRTLNRGFKSAVSHEIIQKAKVVVAG